MRMLMDTVKKKLGYMVRSERERRGLSQAKLAEQAGVSTRTISDIETCNGNPELATLIPIAQFLDILMQLFRMSEKNRTLLPIRLWKNCKTALKTSGKLPYAPCVGFFLHWKKRIHSIKLFSDNIWFLIIRMKSVRNLCGICEVPVNWHKCATKKKHSKIRCFFFIFYLFLNALIASLTLLATSGARTNSDIFCFSITSSSVSSSTWTFSCFEK